ncbi:hypothetical protein DPX16_19997 [Anabarilius grahami]|uniref:Uncharacterized protein n=1 Tax=Anabarilius grahami TaxID=495550 RepID=A0A3N0XR09_ANAGA|nr:hypothetical protein DPX16_19997 [Anabarilius grahami]
MTQGEEWGLLAAESGAWPRLLLQPAARRRTGLEREGDSVFWEREFEACDYSPFLWLWMEEWILEMGKLLGVKRTGCRVVVPHGKNQRTPMEAPLAAVEQRSL